MFKNIDKELFKLGFIKLEDEDAESSYSVSYCRPLQGYSHYHRIDIYHKASGNHLIMSYQEDLNNDGFNNSIGLTYKETKLLMKKYKQMKRKYKWK